MSRSRLRSACLLALSSLSKGGFLLAVGVGEIDHVKRRRDTEIRQRIVPGRRDLLPAFLRGYRPTEYEPLFAARRPMRPAFIEIGPKHDNSPRCEATAAADGPRAQTRTLGAPALWTLS